MIEFLVRLLYVCFLVALYFVGLVLSPPQNVAHASSIDFKLLLPLVSLVFLEFFVRKFSPFFHSVLIENKQFDSRAFCLQFSLFHRGTGPCRYTFGGLSWVQCAILTLRCRFSDGEEREYSVPERFATVLTPEKNIAVITLQSVPGTPLRTIVTLPIRGLRTSFCLAVLWITVNRIAIPHFFWIRTVGDRR